MNHIRTLILLLLFLVTPLGALGAPTASEYINTHLKPLTSPVSTEYKVFPYEEDKTGRAYKAYLPELNLEMGVLVPKTETLSDEHMARLVEYVYQEVTFQRKAYAAVGITLPTSARFRVTGFDLGTGGEIIKDIPLPKFNISLTRFDTRPRQAMFGLILQTNNLQKYVAYDRRAKGLKLSTREISSHEWAHAYMLQFFKDGIPPNQGFAKAFHEGMADYFSWLVHDRKDEYLQRIIKLRRGFDLSQINKYLTTPGYDRELGTILTNLFVDFTKRIEQKFGMAGVQALQKPLYSVFKQFGDEVLINWSDLNLHTYLDAIAAQLKTDSPQLSPLFLGALKASNLELNHKRVPLKNDDYKRVSSLEFFPDYVTPAIIDTRPNEGFLDYRMYKKAWLSGWAFHNTFEGKLWIDSKGEVFRIFINGNRAADGSYELEFNRVSATSGQIFPDTARVKVAFVDDKIHFDLKLDRNNPFWQDFSQVLEYLMTQSYAYEIKTGDERILLTQKEY